MRRSQSFSAGILLISTAILAVEAPAEIYKWVDERGNVHFGDKPRDEEQADRAEQVEIVEGYKPPVRTAEEQAAHERKQQTEKRRREVYQQEDLEARELAQDQARKEKAERCASLGESIGKLSSMESVDGVRTHYYVEDENGKSVTSERQREILEELRQRYAAAGCE
jgi:hypothetical protein